MLQHHENLELVEGQIGRDIVNLTQSLIDTLPKKIMSDVALSAAARFLSWVLINAANGDSEKATEEFNRQGVKIITAYLEHPERWLSRTN